MDYSGHGQPLVSSLLDTDLYKLLMLQLIWRKYRDVPVTFSLVNRTRRVRLAEEIEPGALSAALDEARALRFTADEIDWLANARIYGRTDRFAPDFLGWLKDLTLPAYRLEVEDGQLSLHFSGPWAAVTLWEIPALTTITGLRAQRAVGRMTAAERDHLYGCAIGRLKAKAEQLAALPGLALTDFGTRRRHSLPWQRLCVETLRDRLGAAFGGTSNMLLARELGLPAVGTNGHELPMVLGALAEDDAALREAPYQVLRDWAELYDDGLLVILPDTFGTAAFLRDAPDWAAEWPGLRPDSAPPIEGGEAVLDWWRARGQDPGGKRLIFSDALTVESIAAIHAHFAGRVGVAFGWGTKLTNDLEGCAEAPGLEPISLVCKVTEAGGRPAVKLSDNPEKATGEPAEIARYRKVFGDAGRTARPVEV